MNTNRQSTRQSPVVRDTPRNFTKNESAKKVAISAAIFVLTCLTYRNIIASEFNVLDDPAVITMNPRIKAGLTRDNLMWAFTHSLNANYHPITTLSHMLDVQLFGLNPAGHHLVNVVGHGISAAILFLALNRLTQLIWRSAFVAAIFALHPQHVESVAWIAERKDVLSGLFFSLCVFSYVGYQRKQSILAYFGVVLWFVLGLLSKPMLVTLPAILLTLDFWPVRRTASIGRLIYEKLPLAALALAMCIVTLESQTNVGAVSNWIPVSYRVSNALLSLTRYVGIHFWPVELSIFYPLYHWPVGLIVCAGLGLTLISLIFVLQRRSHPEWLAGWLWFLIMVLPVLGIIQVGAQAMADRYSYLPSIGLTIVITWMIADRISQTNCRLCGMLAMGTVLTLCVARTQVQIEAWRTPVDLFISSIQVVGDDFFLCRPLATALWEHGQKSEAMDVFNAMLQRDPGDSRIYAAIAEMYKRDSMPLQAERYYVAASQLDPTNVSILLDLADCYQSHRDYANSIAAASRAVQIDATSDEARAFLDELRGDAVRNEKEKGQP